MSDCSKFLQNMPKKLLIGGHWVASSSGRTIDTTNPSTGAILGQIAEGDQRDIDRAVVAARKAFEGPWSKFKPAERQALLLRVAEILEANFTELATLDSLDMGVPISSSTGGRDFQVKLLRYYAGLATAINGETIPNSVAGDFISFTIKEPVGVVGAIIPWNAPLGGAIRKIGPVLATGCTLVVKPAEQASLSVLRLGELLLEAGVPEGVINVVTGKGSTAGAALAEHLDVDMITLTGSHLTGQKIIHASASNIKRVHLELGGKSPNIVFADADLDAAVPGAAMAVFRNAGQNCTAGTRLFVERSIHDEFVQRVAEYSKAIKVGNSLDPKIEMGPLVSEAQLERVLGYIDIGKTEGAQAIAGGQRLVDNGLDSGYFVSPTTFVRVNDDMRIANEEIFGPVIAAFAFDDIDEMMHRANKTVFGLGGGVWTRDVSKAHKMARAIRSGTVWVNGYSAMDPAVPFGGLKMSGYGRERGQQHVEEHLETKSVWIKL